jgi:hypothetical protein
MKLPAASCGLSSSLLGRHSVLDTESSRVLWIPAFAGMTNSRQAAGNAPEGIQPTPEHCSGMITGLSQSIGFHDHNAVLILREYQ